MYLWLGLYLNGAHGTLLCPGFFHGELLLLLLLLSLSLLQLS
jgi:hypothetical protein